MNSIKTGSTVFRLKQTHVELISETVRQSFFQRGKKWLWQNLLRGHKYKLKFTALHIFQAKILDYRCLYSCYLTIFLLFDRKRYFEAQTTAPEGLHATICLKKIGTLWWNGVAVIFINEKKRLHQNFLYWYKYVLIFSHSISSRQQAVSVATVNPFDHKQYVNEADKRQLRSKVSFMPTNTCVSGFSQSQLPPRLVAPFQNQCRNFFFLFWF